MYSIIRYHDISAGHRVAGHENKCANLHGHNYRIHFTCTADTLDDLGRVVDFSVVKSKLCMWLEDNWDHKFLAWEQDAYIKELYETIPGKVEFKAAQNFQASILFVPFNPTAENMAEHLVRVVGPMQLQCTGVTLVEVTVDETRKCSATYGRVR